MAESLALPLHEDPGVQGVVILTLLYSAVTLLETD